MSVVFFCAVPNLFAHPVAQGTMAVDISPGNVRVEMIVSMEEVMVQKALSPKSDNADNSIAEVCRRHGEYVLQHLRVLADGNQLVGRLTASKPPSPEQSRPLYQLEYPLSENPGRIRVEQDILNEFDYAPGNRWEATFVVRVVRLGEITTEGFLLTSREPLVVNCDRSGLAHQTRSAATDHGRLFGQYVRHGVLHILTGYDHLLFIGALVLAVVTLWDLVKVITAFTLAHSITLTLSVLNWVRLPAGVVEPMIALSIVFVAVQNVFWPGQTRGLTRLAVAFFFGLFHGLGFAGGLLDAMQGMAGLTIGLAIIAFSVGVEIGHQVVVVPVFVLRKLLLAGEGASLAAGFLFRYGSAAIACAGLFYLVLALRF